MNKEEIVSLALEEGFYKASIIDTDKVIINPDFRKYCEENRCGNYGKNYSCPPSCPSVEEMSQRIRKYKNALTVQSRFEIYDLSCKEKIMEAKSLHNKWMIKLIKKLRSEGYEGLMAGASECSLCSVCEITKGNKCKHPDLSFSCLSAYCVDVLALAGTCEMDYSYKDGILYFFGMYLF